MKIKKIAILGSTGSIGKQALEIIQLHPDHFQAEVLTSNTNSDLLIEQAKIFKPNSVVITDEQYYQQVFEALDPLDIKVFAGEEAISQLVDSDSIDQVLVALVGFAGLKPTLAAIDAKKQIALANKECLVVAGELITKKVIENKVNLIPVDSEHSAIYQCLSGEAGNEIEKIILTASGGPFHQLSPNELANVSREDALNHPNWAMGPKITIDSASLINKGLEVIEAKWLFGLRPDQIEVVIHPQSIIHSMVQFTDGSLKAQMGMPDMRLPIQYALSYPDRLSTPFPRVNFKLLKTLTFDKPDIEKFRNLALAFRALDKGGNSPCVLNAANEVVVEAFLQGTMKFMDMPAVIEQCIDRIPFIEHPLLEDYLKTDLITRELAKKLLAQN